MAQVYKLFVGTYTQQLPWVNGHGKGIHVFSLSVSEDGIVSKSIDDVIEAGENPTFLAFTPDSKLLIAVNECSPGSVIAFRSGPFGNTLVTKVATGGTGSCYVTTDNIGQHLFVADYNSGSASVLRIVNGDIVPLHFFQYSGSASVVPDRQEGPHAHSFMLDPLERFAYVPDLGNDKIWQYVFNDDRQLQENSSQAYAVAPRGCGPRHMAFHPSGQFAYLACELSNQVVVYAIGNDGTLSLHNQLSTLPIDWNGVNYVADIHVTPNGRFVYVSNRGHNSLAAFEVMNGGADLKSAGHYTTSGKTPRNFLIDTDGRFLLVANQDSDVIVPFWIDSQSGALTVAGPAIECPTPVCVQLRLTTE